MSVPVIESIVAQHAEEASFLSEDSRVTEDSRFQSRFQGQVSTRFQQIPGSGINIQ